VGLTGLRRAASITADRISPEDGVMVFPRDRVEDESMGRFPRVAVDPKSIRYQSRNCTDCILLGFWPITLYEV
jgi:hypothetical protein